MKRRKIFIVISILVIIKFINHSYDPNVHDTSSSITEDVNQTIYKSLPKSAQPQKRDNFASDDINNLLFGKWKVMLAYTILPSAFNFNQYENFDKYNSLLDNPQIIAFIEPYNERLIDKILEFTKDKFISSNNEVFYNPFYILQKRDGELYGDNFWDRYRPFRDYFNTSENNYSTYYYFEIFNYESNDEFSIRPKGFIVSYDYIICPVHDDWVFYILERQPD